MEHILSGQFTFTANVFFASTRKEQSNTRAHTQTKMTGPIYFIISVVFFLRHFVFLHLNIVYGLKRETETHWTTHRNYELKIIMMIESCAHTTYLPNRLEMARAHQCNLSMLFYWLSGEKRQQCNQYKTLVYFA